MSLKKATLFIILILLIDQISKIYIKTHFVLGEEVKVFDWFRILFVENEGMAWGAKIPGQYGKLILTLFRLVAICGIGYWLWDEGNVEEIIESLMVASKKRNVKIRIIFNEADKKKRVGKKNKLTIKEYFMQYWKNIIAFPRIYTYKGKIHAKAWVVDSSQILITSANLTGRALERNLELGIRYKGSIAKNVDEIIDRLIEQKYITEV